MWVWVNTYRYIFSGMNIHFPAILGFTRVPRFWLIPIYIYIYICIYTLYFDLCDIYVFSITLKKKNHLLRLVSNCWLCHKVSNSRSHTLAGSNESNARATFCPFLPLGFWITPFASAQAMCRGICPSFRANAWTSRQLQVDGINAQHTAQQKLSSSLGLINWIGINLWINPN